MLEAKREELLNNQQRDFEKQFQRYRESLYNDDEDADSADYEKTSKISFFFFL
jgi:hypothetical protein